MGPDTPKKRKFESNGKRRAPSSKRFKKQTTYWSDPSDESDDGLIARDAPRTLKLAKDKSSNSDPNLMEISSRSRAAVASTTLPNLDEKPSKQDRKAPRKDDGGKSNEEEDIAQDNESVENSEDGSSRSDNSSASDPESDASESSQQMTKTKPKRHDPTAFANSMFAILDSKLTKTQRSNPILVRSKDAQEASASIADAKLEKAARAKLRADKKLDSEKGRVRNVLLGERPDAISEGVETTVAENTEKEKALRKVAMRGVVRMFNSVRSAQVKAKETEKEMKRNGVVGHKQRSEKIGEMGRNAFLEMVGSGGV